VNLAELYNALCKCPENIELGDGRLIQITKWATATETGTDCVSVVIEGVLVPTAPPVPELTDTQLQTDRLKAKFS
jgi:hypothetical protein